MAAVLSLPTTELAEVLGNLAGELHEHAETVAEIAAEAPTLREPLLDVIRWLLAARNELTKLQGDCKVS